MTEMIVLSTQNALGPINPNDHLPESGKLSIPSMLVKAKGILENIPTVILELAKIYQKAGFEFSLVGGPVRDAFLGIEPKDFDFTTSAKPYQSEELLKKWSKTTWSIGKKYGTIGASKAGVQVEVTTYRADQYDLASRKPQVRYSNQLEDDLLRRDFTINSMAMVLPEFRLVDPYGGLEDLAQGILRTPFSATISFSDDPLRMLRAARFVSQLGVSLTKDTLEAIIEMRQRLNIVSAERVQGEFTKLMQGSYPRLGLELMVMTGLMQQVIPEVDLMRETVDEHGRHKDVYQHTLNVVDRVIALETDALGPCPRPDLILRLAALFHDIGKSKTRRFENGKYTFHQHDIVGAKMTKKRLQALKYDNNTIGAVCHLVANHLRFYGYGEQQWTDSAVRRYVTDAGEELERLHRLTRADCTTMNQRKSKYLSFAYDDLERRIYELKQKEALDAIRPDLNGNEIMELLEIKPGKQVGEAYKFLLELRMEQGSLGKSKAAELLLSWWKEQKS